MDQYGQRSFGYHFVHFLTPFSIFIDKESGSLEFFKFYFSKEKASTITLVKGKPYFAIDHKQQENGRLYLQCPLSLKLPISLFLGLAWWWRYMFLELCVCCVCLQGHIQCTKGINRNVSGCWRVLGSIRGQGELKKKGGFVAETWDLVVTE